MINSLAVMLSDKSTPAIVAVFGTSLFTSVVRVEESTFEAKASLILALPSAVL